MQRSLLYACLWLSTLALGNAFLWGQDPTPKAPASGATASFSDHVLPVLKAYCITCHGGKKPKGDLAFDVLADEAAALKQKDLWQRVSANIRSGDMPPSGRKKPSPEQVEKLTRWIDIAVSGVDCTKQRDPGRVTIRRLNKAEYRNTIRDLMGVDFKPTEEFPSDDVGYGFDNIGDVLTLSPLLMERYMAAAEQIVELAFADPDTRSRLVFKPQFDPKGPKGKLKKSDIIRMNVEKFAKRAYRRPVSEDEIARISRFVELAETNSQTTLDGFKLAYQAVLVSPYFLFRVEEDFDRRRKFDEPRPAIRPISDYALASRLSYFLWSSMPDAELFALADAKTLREKGVLEMQVKRMLRDPKARALTDNFAGQWLQLRSVHAATPDPKLFPTFNEKLRDAMIRETELFFETVIKEDRSILDFLDADFTFVNETLAKHYKIPNIKGDTFQRVALTGEQRGGILTHASILTITSNPTRTSLVKRGKWILENILNTPPPPPIPDAGELPEDGAELKGTLRQRMEMHRSKPICASCHQRMDPLGFALENYDPIGAWRTKDGKFPIDSTGTLPNGRTFNGSKELRQLLKGTKELEFRRCLAEKMLTYALGRGLESYDKCAVDDICKAVAANDNRFSSLVVAIVRSDPFQLRKGRGATK